MELVLKIIASVVSVIALSKVITETQSSKAARRREEYEFSKKYIPDLKTEDIHSYSIERGFMALAGRICSEREIRLLLALPFPTRAIRDRVSSQAFIEFDEVSGLYCWQGRYKRPTIQRNGTLALTGLYYVMAFAGIMTVFTLGMGIMASIGSMLFAASTVFIAGGALVRAENLKVARIFMSRWNTDDVPEVGSNNQLNDDAAGDAR